jgi:tetratricopeptide (TPR) repeat protein
MSQIESHHHRQRAAELANLARRHSGKGDYGAAESSLRQALQLLRNDPTNPECLALWNELGMVLKYSGKYDQAERCYRVALRHSYKRFRGAEQQFFRANLYHNLGGLEHSRARFTRAENYARKGLELRLKCCASDTLAVAQDRAALGAILHGRSKYADCERNSMQALGIYRHQYGASHPQIAVVLNNLAALCHATGRPRRAESYYRAALKMKRRWLGRSHPDLAVTMNNLALLFQSQGRKRAAQCWMEKALRIVESTLGDSHPSTIGVRQNRRRTSPPLAWLDPERRNPGRETALKERKC